MSEQGNIVIDVQAKTQTATQGLRQVRREVGSLQGAARSLNIPLTAVSLGIGSLATAAFANARAIHQNREEFWRFRNELDRFAYTAVKGITDAMAPFLDNLATFLGHINNLLGSEDVKENSVLQWLWKLAGGEYSPITLYLKGVNALMEYIQGWNWEGSDFKEFIESLFNNPFNDLTFDFSGVKRQFRELVAFFTGKQAEIDPEMGMREPPKAGIFASITGSIAGLKTGIESLFAHDWWSTALGALDTAKGWLKAKFAEVFEFFFGRQAHTDPEMGTREPGMASLPGRLLDGISNLFADSWWANPLAALDNAKRWITDKLKAIRDEAERIWRETQRFLFGEETDEAGGLDTLQDHRRGRRGFGNNMWGGGPFDPDAAWRQQQEDRGYGSDFGGPGSTYAAKMVPNPVTIQISTLDSQSAAEAVKQTLQDLTQQGASAAPTLQAQRAQFRTLDRGLTEGTTPPTTAAPPVVRVPGRRGL